MVDQYDCMMYQFTALAIHMEMQKEFQQTILLERAIFAAAINLQALPVL